MLRKVKQQVTQALNAVSTIEPRQEVLENEENSFEGLLCPLCMRAFLTTNELQEHFYAHGSQQKEKGTDSPPTFSEPSTKLYDSEQKSFINAEMEIKELKNLLKDERRYSFELKKELDRLQEIAARQTNVPKEEVPYLLQQIQVLEAGKSMITQKLLNLEKTISISGRTNETLKHEKSEMEAKITGLTEKIAKFSANLKQCGLENTRLYEEKIQMEKLIETNTQKIDQLRRQLEQRPSEDDIKVLRQELVRSQQLMDSITQEREVEIAGHVQMIRKLKKQKQILEEDVSEKNEELKTTVVELEKLIREKKQELEGLVCRSIDVENRVAKLEEAVAGKNKTANLVGEEDICKECDCSTVDDLNRKLQESRTYISELIKRLEGRSLDIENLSKENYILKQRLEETGAKVFEIKNRLKTDLKERINVFEGEQNKLQLAADKLALSEDKLQALEKKLCSATTFFLNAINEKERLAEDMTILREKLKKSNGIAAKERMRLEDTLTKTKACKEELEHATSAKNARIFESMGELRKCFEDQKTSIDSLLKSLKTDVEEARRGFVADKQMLQATLCSLAEEYEITQEKNTKLMVANTELKKRFEQKCQELQEIVVEVKKMEDLGKQKSEDLISAKKSYDAEMKCFQDRLNKLQMDNDQILAQNTLLNKEVASLSKAIDETNKLINKKEELLRMQVDENRKLFEEKNSFLKDIEILNSKLRLSEKDASDYCEELKSVKDKLVEVTSRATDLKQELTDKEASIKDLEEELSDKLVQLEVKSAEFEKVMTEMRKKEGDLSSKLANSVKILGRKDKELLLLEEKVEAMCQDIEVHRQKLDKMTEEKALVEKSLQDKNHYAESIEGKLAEMETVYNKETEDFKKMEKKWEDEKSSLCNELEGLRNLLANACKEKSKLEDELDSIKEACEFLKKDCERQIVAKEMFWKESEKRFCDEKSHLERDLRSQVDRAEELAAALKKSETLVEQNTFSINQLKDELKVAVEARNELTRAVSNYNDEKKTLLERCLNTESDLDFERERAVQNRRRFEEVLSAMHELGRANQTLQMDISKQFGRKWLDDTEAVNCNGCKKVFSLMVRKHHCRMCGQIFCASCSSHTAEVPSNKNPVRVCNSCYQELLNR